jgi:hypothetical protein
MPARIIDGIAVARSVTARVPGALLIAEFAADGKMSGSGPENGCVVLGLCSAGSTPTLFWLDFATSGCRYAAFKRRFHGSFIFAKPDST